MLFHLNSSNATCIRIWELQCWPVLGIIDYYSVRPDDLEGSSGWTRNLRRAALEDAEIFPLGEGEEQGGNI